MVISENELKKLLEVNAQLEKVTTLSSDGKNLLSRIPRELVKKLSLEKGDKLRWLLDSNGGISVEVIKLDSSPKYTLRKSYRR